MKISKSCHRLHLPNTFAGTSRASKTSVSSDALIARIKRYRAKELEGRFGPRTDRLTSVHGGVEEKLDIVDEASVLFVLHQLTLTAHPPALIARPRNRGWSAISTLWSSAFGGWHGRGPDTPKINQEFQ